MIRLRQSLPTNPHRAASLAVLVVLAVCQVALNSSFWRAFMVTGFDALVFPVIGVCFTLLDVFGLGVIEDSYAAGDKKRGRAWAAIWLVCLALNFVADFGAAASLVAQDSAQRAKTFAAIADARTQELDAEGALKQAKQSLAALELELPAAVLTARLDGLRKEMSARRAPTLSQIRRETALLSAIALADARDKALEAISRSRQALINLGPGPGEQPGLAAIAAVCNGLHIEATAQSISVVLLLVIAMAMKAALSIGFWVTLRSEPPTRVWPVGDEGVKPSMKAPLNATAPENVPAAPSRTRQRRPIPAMERQEPRAASR